MIDPHMLHGGASSWFWIAAAAYVEVDDAV